MKYITNISVRDMHIKNIHFFTYKGECFILQYLRMFTIRNPASSQSRKENINELPHICKKYALNNTFSLDKIS